MPQVNQNIVQAGTGNGFNPLDRVLRAFARKKELDYRFGQDRQLMYEGHDLAKDRITHQYSQQTMASGAQAAIQSHFDLVKENAVHGNKMAQTKEAGRQERLSETHKGKRATKDLETQTKGLYANSQDPSTGISPLMSAPGRLQNIGPLLKGNPLLGVNPAQNAAKNTGPVETPVVGGKKRGRKPSVAPLAPQIGTDAAPDKGFGQPELPFGDTGAPSVTKPKVKKPRAPRAKKTGTEGGL